jgi:CheY-like chemotaxis protein
MKDGRYIICVADNEDDRFLLANAVAKIDHAMDVKNFSDSNKAVKFLQNALNEYEPPLLIILDYTLPGIEGKNLFFKLKEILGSKYIPVVFFTSNINDISVLELEKEGVPVFLRERSVNGYYDIAQTIINSLVV